MSWPRQRPPRACIWWPLRIGNLGDITLRALETLAGVDIIACEDTRITRRLTERYAISAQLKPYHEHNAALARPKILERLAQGASIAWSRMPARP
jgi:16S rRNA (cytidine1402-2'-O)-methyltransferase